MVCRKLPGESVFFRWLLSVSADLQLLELEAGVFSHALDFHHLDAGLHQLVDQVLRHLSPVDRAHVTQSMYHSPDGLKDSQGHQRSLTSKIIDIITVTSPKLIDIVKDQ